ncbi:MAG: hypothetical protein JJU00_16760 [Opitutales bacterium]|nr:hypothetical protein [Opitutales bacterium]
MPGGIDGHSLAAVAQGGASPVREELYGLCGKHHFLVGERYKYLWFADTNEEQLFDLREDPKEKHDLSGEASLIGPMRERMAAHTAIRPEVGYEPEALRPCANKPPESLFKGA